MATKMKKDTVDRMLVKLQKKLDDLYLEQEAMSSQSGEQEMKCGGKVKKMPGGGFIPGALDLFNSLGGVDAAKGFNLGGLLSGIGISRPGGPMGFNMDFDSGNLNPYSSGSTAFGGGTFGQTLTADPTNYSLNVLGQGLTDAPVDTWNGISTGNSLDAQGDKFDWKNLGYGLATAAPAIYNMAQGLQKPEQMNAPDFYNPKANQALNRMNQKYDPNQQLRQAEQDYATSKYSLDQMAGGDRSTRNRNLQGLLNTTQRTKAGILDNTQKANMEQQNRLAGAELGVGEGMAQTNWNVDVANAQNRAARRRHLGQAFSDISGLVQTNRLMNNQMGRDQTLADILPDLYKTVSPFSPWMNNIKVNQNA